MFGNVNTCASCIILSFGRKILYIASLIMLLIDFGHNFKTLKLKLWQSIAHKVKKNLLSPEVENCTSQSQTHQA